MWSQSRKQKMALYKSSIAAWSSSVTLCNVSLEAAEEIQAKRFILLRKDCVCACDMV